MSFHLSGSSASAKSSTLPLPHRLNVERPYVPKERERDGYYRWVQNTLGMMRELRQRTAWRNFQTPLQLKALIQSFLFSDRNELIRERERERERDRGYLSDHNSRWVFTRSSPSTVQFHKPPFSYSTSRCASCIGESARAQWFRHSDGWRSGSSTLGSGTNLISQGTGHRRSPWDSLPSLKQDGSLNDSGYKSTRADSFEQRLAFDIFVFSHLNTILRISRHSETPLLANLIFEEHCKNRNTFSIPQRRIWSSR